MGSPAEVNVSVVISTILRTRFCSLTLEAAVLVAISLIAINNRSWHTICTSHSVFECDVQRKSFGVLATYDHATLLCNQHCSLVSLDFRSLG